MGSVLAGPDGPSETAVIVRVTRKFQSAVGAAVLFMIVEHFRGGDAVPVYRRFRDQGRLAPEAFTTLQVG